MKATDHVENSTRSRLIEAAQHLLWTRSYQATGVDEICARSNAKKGSFYHFFGSKTELAIAAVEANWSTFRAEVFLPILASEPPGLAQLARLVDTVDQLQRRMLGQTGSFLGCPFGNLGQEMAHQDPGLREVLQRIFQEHCDCFETMIQTAIDRGEILEADARRRAEEVFAFLEGALLLAKVSNDPDRFTTLASSLLPGEQEKRWPTRPALRG